MSKYIDADQLKAEIERLKDTAWRRADNRYGREDANTYEAWAGAYETVLEILDTLPEQPVSDHHEIEVEFRGEKVTISREFYRDGEMNYSTSEQDDNAIWSALRAWCEKKGITPFELYPMGRCNLKQSDDCYGCPYWGTGDVDGCKLTIQFHKLYPYGTRQEYADYMLKHGRKDGSV